MPEAARFSAGGVEGRKVMPVAAAGSPPAVVVLGNVMGLSPFLDDIQQWLAQRGASSVALDYYSFLPRPPLGTREEKLAAAEMICSDDTVSIVLDVVRSLRESAPAVAVVGYCVGGSLAAMVAAAPDGPDAAAMFYGQLVYPEDARRSIQPLEALRHVSRPFQAHFGGKDPLTPADQVDTARAALTRPGQTVYVYDDAGHAFDEHDRPETYSPIASDLARAALAEFLMKEREVD